MIQLQTDIIIKLKNIIQGSIENHKIWYIGEILREVEKRFPKFDDNIGIGLYKDFILDDDIFIELGGPNHNSTLVIESIDSKEIIDSGKITLIGPDLNEITKKSVDFGILIFIKMNKAILSRIHKIYDLKFLSDGINGFMIRSIPRKFWCRLNEKFFQGNFEIKYLGLAIYKLFMKKYPNLIETLEIIFICSDRKLINEINDLNRKFLELRKNFEQRKLKRWRDQSDCDFDWNCEDCPYYENCSKIKSILNKRNSLEY